MTGEQDKTRAMELTRGHGVDTRLVWNSVMSALREPSNPSEVVREKNTYWITRLELVWVERSMPRQQRQVAVWWAWGSDEMASTVALVSLDTSPATRMMSRDEGQTGTSTGTWVATRRSRRAGEG